jgi:hypothetical protein
MKRSNLYFAVCIMVCFAFPKHTEAQTDPPHSKTNISDISLDYMSEGTAKTATNGIAADNIEGSPYFYENWMPGEAVLSDGKTYKNLLLKYDELSGSLIFKYKMADTALAFAIPAVGFRFYSLAGKNLPGYIYFKNGFDRIDGANTNTFYQVLSDGDTELLKITTKRIVKTQEFGSPVVKGHVEGKASYYIAKNKKLVRVKNDNKAVLAVLSDKEEKIKQYIADNKLDVKNDSDFAAVINYYNEQ